MMGEDIMHAGTRVALIRPRYAGEDYEFEEPLGAEAICGYLREKHAEARVFDRRLNASVREISDYNPDWIGFSLMTIEDTPDALRLQQMLHRSGRRFFAGGLFVTNNPDQARALFPAETVLIPGEGEGPVWELITTGAVQGGLVPEPDEWAFASRDQMGDYLERGGVINIRTSRGCKGACTFCTTPRNGKPAGHTVRSIEKIADEMLQISQEGFEPVYNFTDDMFGDHTRIESLIRALEERKLRAAFSLEMRAREAIHTPAELWQVLHKGGLCRVFTGLESFNAETLKAWQKPLDTEKLLESVTKMREAGIACEVGYILWHDGTSPEDAIKEAEKLHEHGLLSPKSALSRLVVFRGSGLYETWMTDSMYLCRLQPEAGRKYAEWESLLSSIIPLWTAASCAHPKMACSAFLHREEEPKLQQLEACLEHIKEITWQTLSKGKEPADEVCEEIRGELIALHVAGTGCQ